MTDYAALLQPDKGQLAHDLMLVNADGMDGWRKSASEAHREAARAQGFEGKGFQIAILPGEPGERWSALLGVADPDSLSSWCLAKAAETLPEGIYRVAGHEPGSAALGWLLAQYRFDRYRAKPEPAKPRVLLTPQAGAIEGLVALAEAFDLVRSMVNTGAGDMGPAEIEQTARDIAAGGGEVHVTAGDALDQGFPMVAAVGRAATRQRAPRLIELEWGDPAHPRVAIIGKGVCFDSGGLDIKPAAGMLLMKKDMGGAAHALALARLVIGARLPVRLHMIVPAVENAIAADAFRPGDVLASRKGISVEIGNTDAEGRLILGDALALACEGKPELIVDFATLTGAARVALGPDLPALFTPDDDLADALRKTGEAEDDPLWRLPLWSPYEELLASDIADTNNAAQGQLAGATTAALFLRKFVDPDIAWAHLDTFAWRPAAKPGRPRGGEALGLRAVWRLLQDRYGEA
ncbi:MAG: leucyl aminopeptidase family protein [Sphingomonadaceae bacterium]|nr:leucyl aminopeptidase family protein [Sphingomonadaceae bacterium]